MKLIHSFLIFLVLFLILIISLWFVPAPKFSTGMPHPEFKTMLIGGESIATSRPAMIASYLFGLAVILMMYFFVLFSTQRKKDIGQLNIWLSIGFAVYIFVYTMMFFSYLNYATTGHDRFFLGWPTPTAWMIYGMWAAPSLIMLVYIVKFKEWILDDEDELTFQKILADRQSRMTN